MSATHKAVNRKKSELIQIRSEPETKAMLAELASNDGITASAYFTQWVRREHAKLRKSRRPE